jgi:hypothetical protein
MDESRGVSEVQSYPPRATRLGTSRAVTGPVKQKIGSPFPAAARRDELGRRHGGPPDFPLDRKAAPRGQPRFAGS